MKTSLKAGIAREIITPPVGTILYGYPPGRPSESVHDNLRVTCLALESGSVKAMLISADICTLSETDSNRLRGMIWDKTGIPAENILFCSTHTHSGPATRAGPGWGVTDVAYNRELLEPRTVKAAQAACAGLRDSLIGIGVTMSDIGINRRELNRHGKVSLGQNPWAPYDPEMTVLSFRSLDGEPVANLIHYCCHGTAAGRNPEITRDWSGPMVDALEEQSGAMTVFFNGAEGDVGPRLPNGKTTGGGNLNFALDLGARAGNDAVRAWRTIKDYRDAPVKAINGEIQLPYKPLPDPAVARAELDALGDPEKLSGMNSRKHNHWELVVAEHESGRPLQKHGSLRQSIVALGPVAFVPFPFEVFVEITLRIRNLSPFQHTLCLSNANGAFGYFPTLDQYPRGGYEIAVARFFQAYEMAEDADSAAVHQNLELLEKLAGV